MVQLLVVVEAVRSGRVRAAAQGPQGQHGEQVVVVARVEWREMLVLVGVVPTAYQQRGEREVSNDDRRRWSTEEMSMDFSSG